MKKRTVGRPPDLVASIIATIEKNCAEIFIADFNLLKQKIVDRNEGDCYFAKRIAIIKVSCKNFISSSIQSIKRPEWVCQRLNQILDNLDISKLSTQEKDLYDYIKQTIADLQARIPA